MVDFVAAFLPLESDWGRILLSGVEKRCAERGVALKVYTEPIVNPIEELGSDNCRGIVMMPQSLRSIGPYRQAERLLELNQRVINCSSEPLTQALLHSVCSDAKAVGKLSGQFLKHKGIQHVAALAPWGMIYNQLRLKHLRSMFPTVFSSTGSGPSQVHAICDWLQDVALDKTAVLVDSCKRAELFLAHYRGPLPNLLCWEDSARAALLKPPLTTIDLAFDEVGKQSVDQLLQASWPPAQALYLVPPRAIIERQSTTKQLPPMVQALTDAVQKALPGRPSVDALAAQLGTSKRSLTRHIHHQAGSAILPLINPLRARAFKQRIEQGHDPSALAQAAQFGDKRALMRFIDRWQ